MCSYNLFRMIQCGARRIFSIMKIYLIKLKFTCVGADPNIRQSDRSRGGVAEVPDVAVAGRAGLLPAGGAVRGARGGRRGTPRLAAGTRGLRGRRLQEAQHRAHRAAAVRRQPA